MKHNNKGFTVIELLTALTLLTLVIFTFTPIVSFSLAQIATAGQYNAALHDATGDLEGAQAQILDEITVTNADAVTNDVKVVFQKAGSTGVSGSTVEYATGTELQPTDSSSLLDDLLSFVGIKVEGSLTLEPSSISMKDYTTGDKIDVTVTPVGFTFRETSVDSKMKLVDKTGTEVLNQDGSDIDFSYNASTGKVTFQMEYETLDPSLAPYRVYYGKYFAYQPIEIIDFDMFDLIVGGANGRVAVAEGSADTTTGQYTWMFDDYSIDYAGDERTINDILWMDATDTNDERFVGVGDDGLYFELTEANGLTFPVLKGSVNGGTNYTTYDGDDPSTDADLNQAVVLDKTDGTIAVAGNLLVVGEVTPGQYTIPTGGTSGNIGISGMMSEGDVEELRQGHWITGYFTTYKYERFYGSTIYDEVNTKILMNSATLCVASGEIKDTTYTLTVADNGRVYYYDGSSSSALQFSERTDGNFNYNIERCTVPADITDNEDADSVQPTAIAYGEEMFMIGMADGSIYCTDDPDATSGTYYGFGSLEDTDGNTSAINSITYVESADKWVAVGDGGLILWRDGGDPGDEDWTKLSATNSSHDIYGLSANLNEVKCIEKSNSTVEVFVVGEKSTILHVKAGKIDKPKQWIQDVVYTYDMEEDKYSENTTLSLNTVARKIVGG